MHVFAGAGLEDGIAFPGKEPAVVVGAEDALSVGREHGRDGRVGEERPDVGGWVEDFAVLAALTSGPGATDCEHVAIRKGHGRLIAAGNVHR